MSLDASSSSWSSAVGSSANFASADSSAHFSPAVGSFADFASADSSSASFSAQRSPVLEGFCTHPPRCILSRRLPAMPLAGTKGDAAMLPSSPVVDGDAVFGRSATRGRGEVKVGAEGGVTSSTLSSLTASKGVIVDEGSVGATAGFRVEMGPCSTFHASTDIVS
ncbi:unnamed protein product [Closterium sp. NIES-53]